MRKKASLKDIASQVGVSTALVSYVLNNQHEEKRVGKEIALKIREVAAALNYTPNQIARSLKTRKTNTIGIVVADIDYGYTSGVTKAIEAACQQLDYTVIYGSSGESAVKFERLVSLLVDRQVDGLILVPVEGSAPAIERLNKLEIPFVLIDRILPDVNANIIAIDNAKTAYRSTTQLIRHGYKRIGFISYRSGLLNLLDRKNGYLAALGEAGMEKDAALIMEIADRAGSEGKGFGDQATAESGARGFGERVTAESGAKGFGERVRVAIDTLLKLPSPCDSIFFATDTLAVEGLRHINALNIRVPERLGIVSFDDSEAFELFYCPITHGVQPLEEIGRVAVDTLLDAMKHPKTRKKILLETEFKVGRSCGEGG
jgi:LacI family transcriptional regulator, galactose operon repressor